MGSLSRMAKKCESCPKRDKCNHKYMEACAYIDKPNAKRATVNNAVNASMPNMRETMKINVGGDIITAYKDEIEKEIYKALRESFSIGLSRGGM